MTLSLDQFAKLRLIRSVNIGPVSYLQLLARYGTAARALEALPELARNGGGRSPQIADKRAVAREVERTLALGGRYLFLGEAAYPSLLAETDSAPPVLIIRGDSSLATKPVVAVVGARNASAAAVRFARGLAQELSAEGIVIASGLARGIDTAAHIGALAQPAGGTIGVIASGLDIVFPPENAALQEQIASQALLVTEHVPGREPLARHFPARNRIIAGLALGTIVVEAAPRSGSLITARLANEAGREVMAVPGSPLDPRAQGCNLLIREGATLIQSAADVLEAVRPLGLPPVAALRAPHMHYNPQPPKPLEADNAARRCIIGLLGPVPVAVDELIRQSALPSQVVQLVLLELELAARLTRHAGGRVSLEA